VTTTGKAARQWKISGEFAENPVPNAFLEIEILIKMVLRLNS
jgi:hypothetical protein